MAGCFPQYLAAILSGRLRPVFPGSGGVVDRLRSVLAARVLELDDDVVGVGEVLDRKCFAGVRRALFAIDVVGVCLRHRYGKLRSPEYRSFARRNPDRGVVVTLRNSLEREDHARVTGTRSRAEMIC